jgi:hypothetical protein
LGRAYRKGRLARRIRVYLAPKVLVIDEVSYLPLDVLLQMLRRLGLAGTELAKAQCATIRLKLLKIGALMRISVRKVWVSLAGGYPYIALFRQVHEKLCAVPLKC